MRFLTALRSFLFISIWIIWWQITDYKQKRNAFICGILFAGIELIYTSSVPDHTISRFSLFCQLHHAKTSWSQFWVLIFFFPFIVEPYAWLFEGHLAFDWVIRIVFSPLMVWVLEICEGYLLHLIMGANTAWHYTGEDAFFHGNIKIGMYSSWWGLGIITELIFTLVHYLES
eukprot:TRINITY_DN14992_c0_g1_i1.p1 TRINITY_DN14992_c0_g1~~TRINITY_DN14992_c0_g1_i1.p1  ORF type:complete len:172 (-),score=28.79 TRINITY_DN14992_c0_g1_i1:55-570(-)